MNWKEKYLKYKKKYFKLKASNNIQLGGFTLTYLGQGAESFVYDIGDNKVIKIRKIPDTPFTELEERIMTVLTELDLPNFPKLFATGNCKQREPISEETRSFCESSDGTITYHYEIFDKVDGPNIINIFMEEFRHWLTQDSINFTEPALLSKANDFIRKYIIIIKQIANALYLANVHARFRHVDCNYRNILIKNYESSPVPVLIDFGTSTIGDMTTLECSDINFFINNLLRGTSFDKSSVDFIFGPNHPKLVLIRKNCKEILDKVILRDPEIIKLKNFMSTCLPYMQSDIEINKINEFIKTLH